MTFKVGDIVVWHSTEYPHNSYNGTIHRVTAEVDSDGFARGCPVNDSTDEWYLWHKYLTNVITLGLDGVAALLIKRNKQENFL